MWMGLALLVRGTRGGRSERMSRGGNSGWVPTPPAGAGSTRDAAARVSVLLAGAPLALVARGRLAVAELLRVGCGGDGGNELGLRCRQRSQVPFLAHLRHVLGEVHRRTERIVKERRDEEQPNGKGEARPPHAQQQLDADVLVERLQATQEEALVAAHCQSLPFTL